MKKIFLVLLVALISGCSQMKSCPASGRDNGSEKKSCQSEGKSCGCEKKACGSGCEEKKGCGK